MKRPETSGETEITLLRRDELQTNPETFQFREAEVTEHHVRALADLLKKDKTLDPLTVWQNQAGTYVVIDGHHRYEAYRRVKPDASIPVRIFKCTEADAVLMALDENTKTRLQMTATEKSNAAWRLCCSDHPYSKSQVCRATGISDGTVAKMRRVKRDLNAKDEFLPDTWWQAMHVWKGLEQTELDEDMIQARIEARANALDEKIGGELSKMSDIQWEAVAIVLERRLGKNERIILDYLGAFDAEEETSIF